MCNGFHHGRCNMQQALLSILSWTICDLRHFRRQFRLWRLEGLLLSLFSWFGITDDARYRSFNGHRAYTCTQHSITTNTNYTERTCAATKQTNYHEQRTDIRNFANYLDKQRKPPLYTHTHTHTHLLTTTNTF